MNYNDWKNQLASNPDILGGELCFPGTRLSVRHIGQRLYLKETSVSEVLEDYPYLTKKDCQNAFLLVSIEQLEDIT